MDTAGNTFAASYECFQYETKECEWRAYDYCHWTGGGEWIIPENDIYICSYFSNLFFA